MRPTTQHRWQRVLEAVAAAGHHDGDNAAAWWQQDTLGGRATGEVTTTARRVSAGLDDGDPHILDSLPTAGHPQRLRQAYRDATGEHPPWQHLTAHQRDQALHTYLDGFYTAVAHAAATTATRNSPHRPNPRPRNPSGQKGQLFMSEPSVDRTISVADPVRRKTRVLCRQCDTCVFRPGNPMHLAPGHLAHLVDQARAADSYIICHDTLPYGPHPHYGAAVCRGFYDRYDTRALQLARRLWGHHRGPTTGRAARPAREHDRQRHR